MLSSLESEAAVVAAQVQCHRNARVPESIIAGLPSGIRLAELRDITRGEAPREPKFTADLHHLEAVVAMHRSAGLSKEAIARTESGRRLARLHGHLA